MNIRGSSIIGLLVALAPTAWAGSHNMAGCGLGYVLFRPNSKGTQLIAATTNTGVSSNQTFGMSSETLGCTQDGLVKAEKRREVYAAVNLQKLSQEMSRGGGEYLDGFAALTGCREPAAREAFARFSQRSFERLFPGPNTGPDAFLANLDRELAKDKALSKACSS